MEYIRNIIWEILESPTQNQPNKPPRVEMTESFNDTEYDDIFTDLYLSIRNIEAFYHPEMDEKASLLLESFILESMIVLKENPEVSWVTSGPNYVKATAFTPDSETASYLLENAIAINTMLGLYNDALAENGMPQIDGGIGLYSFQSELASHECGCEGCGDEGCECDECGDEGCGCDHEEETGLDIHNENPFAELLANEANSDTYDPMILNEGFYGLVSDFLSDKVMLDEHFKKTTIELLDLVIYHGNVVIEE